mmetsp:Transcript_35939/g.108605  ORF Transcript_35939/g.108605 Transcript_35939/m.108605 type:complete len:244 (-) Transcript_35939:606-1337(-)
MARPRELRRVPHVAAGVAGELVVGPRVCRAHRVYLRRYLQGVEEARAAGLEPRPGRVLRAHAGAVRRLGGAWGPFRRAGVRERRPFARDDVRHLDGVVRGEHLEQPEEVPEDEDDVRAVQVAKAGQRVQRAQRERERVHPDRHAVRVPCLRHGAARALERDVPDLAGEHRRVVHARLPKPRPLIEFVLGVRGADVGNLLRGEAPLEGGLHVAVAARPRLRHPGDELRDHRLEDGAAVLARADD